MYPVQCYAGFSMPARAGKFQILGFVAAVNDPTVDSQFAIVDDSTLTESNSWGRVLTSAQLTEAEVVIGNVKGIANVDGTLGMMFPEPIKTRNGISVYAKNLKGGSTCVFVR